MQAHVEKLLTELKCEWRREEFPQVSSGKPYQNVEHSSSMVRTGTQYLVLSGELCGLWQASGVEADDEILHQMRSKLTAQWDAHMSSIKLIGHALRDMGW